MASIASTVMVLLRSRGHDGATASGTNAASQWVWGRQARRTRGWSWRHTALGYAIYHASSVFWACGYEGWNALRPPRRQPPLGRAAAIAVLAWWVDYHVVPPRLSPGFEHRIGRAGMFLTYAAFAAGLAAASHPRTRQLPRRAR